MRKKVELFFAFFLFFANYSFPYFFLHIEGLLLAQVCAEYFIEKILFSSFETFLSAKNFCFLIFYHYEMKFTRSLAFNLALVLADLQLELHIMQMQ